MSRGILRSHRARRWLVLVTTMALSGGAIIHSANPAAADCWVYENGNTCLLDGNLPETLVNTVVGVTNSPTVTNAINTAYGLATSAIPTAEYEASWAQQTVASAPGTALPLIYSVVQSGTSTALQVVGVLGSTANGAVSSVIGVANGGMGTVQTALAQVGSEAAWAQATAASTANSTTTTASSTGTSTVSTVEPNDGGGPYIPATTDQAALLSYQPPADVVIAHNELVAEEAVAATESSAAGLGGVTLESAGWGATLPFGGAGWPNTGPGDSKTTGYIFNQQLSNTCGPSSTRNVLYYITGHDFGEAALAQEEGTNSSGTDVRPIAQTLNNHQGRWKYNFQAPTSVTNLGDIVQADVSSNVPMIQNVIEEGLWYYNGHTGTHYNMSYAFYWYGYGTASDSVVIDVADENDPYRGGWSGRYTANPFGYHQEDGQELYVAIHRSPTQDVVF
jgi:hypothetical protein